MSAIEFRKKYSMQNGNKLTKKNWQHVYAVSSEPCTNILGVPAIEAAKAAEGAYFMKWNLVFEKATPESKGGYIFREINCNCGINGHHKTAKEAVWHAMHGNRIRIFIQKGTQS